MKTYSRIWSLINPALLVPVLLLAGTGGTIYVHTCNSRGTVEVIAVFYDNGSCHNGTCCTDEKTVDRNCCKAPVTDAGFCNEEIKDKCCQTDVITDFSADRINHTVKNILPAPEGSAILLSATNNSQFSETVTGKFLPERREKYGGKSLIIQQHRLNT